jgi:hypothetical protein
MKLFAFLVSLVLLIGSFALFGYAFTFGDHANLWLFVAGIAAASLAFAIPFHVLEKFD